MLRTKLYRPKLSPDTIFRSQLIAELNKNKSKSLILVTAPAGYGKSTLISQWIEVSNINASWISLDEDFNDVRHFLSYCIEAIHLLVPDLLIHIQLMLNSNSELKVKIIYEELLNSLLNYHGELTIVFDDFHIIKNAEVHDLINFFLKNPPGNIHLILITRKDLPLNTNQLRLYDKVHEIDTSHLVLTEEEVNDIVFNKKQKTSTKKEIQGLLKKTEGWVLGLKMILLAYGKNDTSLDSFNEKTTYLDDFSKFIEVDSLKQFDGNFRDLLLHSSLLNVFDASLIDHLIKITDSGIKHDGKSFIEELINRNLFIISLDNEGKYYRFHHLFKELLYHQLLKSTDPNGLNALYLKISEHFENINKIDEAIFYALKTNDFDYIAQIINKNRIKILNNDTWWIVKKWMDQIPEHYIAKDSGLMSAQLFSYEDAYRFSEIPALLQLMEKSLKNIQNKELDREFYFHNAFISLWLNADAASTIKYLEIAKNILDDEGVITRRSTFYLAVAKQMMGKESEAISDLKTLMEKNPYSIYSNLEFAVSIVYLLSGKIKEASVSAENLCFSMKESKNIQISAWANYLYANSLFQAFDMEKANVSFKKALHLNPFFQYRLSVDTIIGRILSCYLFNNKEEGEKLKNSMQKLAREFKLEGIAESCEARIQLLTGNIDAARNWEKNHYIDFHIRDFQFLIEVPLITKARIIIETGTYSEIIATLNNLKIYLDLNLKKYNRYHFVDLLVLQALGHFKIKEQEEAERFLKKAMVFGEANSFIRPFIEPGNLMKELIQQSHLEYNYMSFAKKIIDLIDAYFPKNEFDSSSSNYFIVKELKLTNREIEVIRIASTGLRNQEIADSLNVSLETVKSHIKNSLKKLKVKNRVEMIRKASVLDIID